MRRRTEYIYLNIYSVLLLLRLRTSILLYIVVRPSEHLYIVVRSFDSYPVTEKYAKKFKITDISFWTVFSDFYGEVKIVSALEKVYPH